MPAAKNEMTVTLPSDREIKLTRVFNAPRRFVYEAMTSCEHLSHWWGPAKYKFVKCDMDFRPGGKWRIVQSGPDGEEFAFRGEYREIVPNERVVQTFEFEPMAGHVSVETMTLTEKDGKTTLTTVSRFDSKEDRDGMLQSGMESGAAETYDRLEQYVPELQGAAVH
jgi:uncharacterized protein YndB with AHSA1/START domain